LECSGNPERGAKAERFFFGLVKDHPMLLSATGSVAGLCHGRPGNQKPRQDTWRKRISLVATKAGASHRAGLAGRPRRPYIGTTPSSLPATTAASRPVLRSSAFPNPPCDSAQ